jgi:hypothetical protein
MKYALLTALVLVSFTATSAQNQPLILMTTRTEGPPEPRLEAIAIIEQGRFKAPAGVKNKEAATFNQKYLPKGQKLFLIFGGGAAGTVNVTENGLGCNDRIYAIGSFNPGSLGITRIRGQLQGLATNSDKIARSEIWRRAPTAEERAAAVGLAKMHFSNKGVTLAQVAKMQTANLTAIDVDGDNRAELVGTFRLPTVDNNRPPRYLFLIAEGEGANYKTAFSSYRHFPQTEIFNVGEETLIDYLDLDRDGVAEIVTSHSTDTASGYHIYRRVGGGGSSGPEWKVVYGYATDFCTSEGGH